MTLVHLKVPYYCTLTLSNNGKIKNKSLQIYLCWFSENNYSLKTSRRLLISSFYLLPFRAPRSSYGDDWWFVTFYQTIIYFGVSLVIPTLILVFVTFNLIRSLNKAKEKKARMQKVNFVDQSGKSKKSRSEDLTLMLIIVVIVFVMCNLFNPIRRSLISTYGNSAGWCPHHLYPITSLTATVHIYNASVNFVIYVLCGKTFRNRVRALLICRKNKVGHWGFTSNSRGTASRSTASSNNQSLKFQKWLDGSPSFIHVSFCNQSFLKA